MGTSPSSYIQVPPPGFVNIFAWSPPSQLRVFVRFENSSLPRIWKLSNLVSIFNILFCFMLNKMMATGVIKGQGIGKLLEGNENLHPWVKVDQAVRPLPLRSLNILSGLTLKLYSLCIIVSVVGNIWTLWFAFTIFCVARLERSVLVGISQNVKIL